LCPRRAQILSVAVAAFPMKGSLIEMGYSENAINFIVNGSVIYLFVSSYHIVAHCVHGWDELGHNM
jgi:hypothetical protein